LTRKIFTGIAILLALLAVVQPSPATERTGTLRGKITDSQGFPLAGAYLYLASPGLLGIRNFITSEHGRYGFLGLPPGVYKITVEVPGFKTVKIEGIALAAGTAALIDFKMEPTEAEEETVNRAPGPGLDPTTARLAPVLDKDLLTHIPLPRDFSAVLGLVPGAVFENNLPGASVSFHGAPATSNAFVEDGVNVTNPVSRTPMPRIDVDVIDQVVVETAGLPVDRGPGQGAYINVVGRSGANDFDGSLAFYYTGQGLSKSLWSDQETGANNAAAPRVDKSNLDLAFTAGGPLLHDLGWFFSNLRFRPKSQSTSFQPWKDPTNVLHPSYNWRDNDFAGMLKLSAQPTKQFRGVIELNASKITEPVYDSDVAWNRPEESTRRLDGQNFFLAKAGIVYTMDQRTFLDGSVGYMKDKQALLLNAAGLSKASFFDNGTGRVWGSGPFNDWERRKRFRGNLTLTRLQDRTLGVAHELIIGGDYETGKAESNVWKANDLIMNYFNGSPYSLGQAVSPTSGNTVGLGQIGFSIIPNGSATTASGRLATTRKITRLGGFIQDTLTFGSRVSLSLGLRLDHTATQILEVTKGAVGNAVALSVGNTVIKPVYGFNPFTAGAFGQWDNVIVWSSLSPRFGLSVDLFGTGKTLFRGSFSILPENQDLGYTRNLDPVLVDRIHHFYWYDENGDGKVDTADTFVPLPFNYAVYTSLFKTRVDANLQAPLTYEWTAGLEHELIRDFSLSVRYISRTEKGVIGDVMYDPATDRAWYTVQGSPAGWWVPFTTTVPASAAYPATDVTVYFRSTTAPAVFDRIQEVPELSRKYRGLEFSFRKRMSNNWQLFGSVVWSRSTGTTGLAAPLSAGLTSPVLTPNSFINVPAGSRTDMDRPLAIRVMGTVRFKWDFYLSAYYRYTSGSTWARSVTITAPAAWAEEHGTDATPVTVFLESPGTRRHASLQSTDLRLEKEFKRGGRTRWSAYIDVLNLFGAKYRIIDYNDGSWFPDGEGGSSGTHVLSGTYGQAIFLSGTRTVAFSLQLKF
jgi:hypothetical protein